MGCLFLDLFLFGGVSVRSKRRFLLRWEGGFGGLGAAGFAMASL